MSLYWKNLDMVPSAHDVKEYRENSLLPVERFEWVLERSFKTLKKEKKKKESQP